ncbi:MAG: hypothetical protein AAGJ80_20735, partial [Cyanobacteria bacterium J06553_1]
LVTQLERQKIVAEEAIRLSREQVDAVSALLSEKVSRENQAESRRALIRDFLFLIAGIALRQIHQGKIIPNPEAWLKVTTMRLLMKERRKKGRARSSWYTPQSLDAPATSEGTRPLIEQVAAPRDRDNPYLVFDKAEAADKAANNHKRLAKALKGLTPFERKLLQLKQVENKSWKEIHRQLKFEGNIPALRKQGSRALSKVRKTYQALEDKV